MTKISKPESSLKQYYENADTGVKISINKDNKRGFMGFHCTFTNFKTLKPGEKNKMTFGNSGVENIIPYLLEVDLIGTWAPYLNYFKKI